MIFFFAALSSMCVVAPCRRYACTSSIGAMERCHEVGRARLAHEAFCSRCQLNIRKIESAVAHIALDLSAVTRCEEPRDELIDTERSHTAARTPCFIGRIHRLAGHLAPPLAPQDLSAKYLGSSLPRMRRSLAVTCFAQDFPNDKRGDD